ncbi:hypothetical protein TWF506_003309 [Arthrobotrys conoides]|uniref:Subtilisin-like serine protease n=1 Tax=Arthrobotrys conoides TaxID=74498 RepID=A0AAN8P7W3_9PEZI
MGDEKSPFHVTVGGPDQSEDISLRERLAVHLPSTFRTKNDHLSTPSFEDPEFLRRELLVPRLDDIQDHLWLVGRPMPPRPLHYQVILSRDIVITESMDLHLVWADKRIFIKPVPGYLLDPEFWSTHLMCPENMDIQQRQYREELAKAARGFLFTYTALIAYESDFRIALESGLISHKITWDYWRKFCRQFVQDFQYSSVNPRFWYGELRLSRLNSIYRWRKGLLWRGYSKIASHMSYGDLLRDNFHLLAAILGYVVIVLTAMQVGLATERLATNVPFQDVSYGTAVLAMIVPLIVGVAIFAIVLFIVVYNWLVTKTYEKRRFKEMGVLPDWGGDTGARGGRMNL